MTTRIPLVSLLLSLALLGAAQADSVVVGTWTFEPGEGWSAQTPSSSMRAAELKFDAPSAEDADDPVAAFFNFGGGVTANIERWKGQFEGGPTDEETIEYDNGAILVVLSGTFLESMGGPFSGNQTPKEGYRMLGAILPNSEGSAVFIKMTAPEAIADETRASFEDLIKTAEQ